MDKPDRIREMLIKIERLNIEKKSTTCNVSINNYTETFKPEVKNKKLLYWISKSGDDTRILAQKNLIKWVYIVKDSDSEYKYEQVKAVENNKHQCDSLFYLGT